MNDAAAVDQALQPLVAPLLRALTALSQEQRYLHPLLLQKVVEQAQVQAQPLAVVRDALPPVAMPAALTAVVGALDSALALTEKALAALRETPSDPEGIYVAYRALRYLPYAMEALYPLTAACAAVSAFFLEAGASEEQIARCRLAPTGAHRGVQHFNNERGTKGGYSVYVPEYLKAGGRHPVVCALHGGGGHGRGFLWTWLKEARTRGFILVSPTSRGPTWALTGPDIDSDNLEAILARVDERWGVDEHRTLLTGMSDGGTFTFISGLRGASPFTHLAPVAASFHPMMIELIEAPAINARPIYLTHGVHDWMFAIDVARAANEVLTGLGAQVVYREIEDLAHTYPREENARILDWFLP
ncbi:MAG: phospholipase [Gammaproteobacteria bacterium]|nr:phospholipase [Gammaproteobacteria bacterium]